VDDRTTPVWIRLVGAVVMLTMVVASVAIVGRGSSPSPRPSPDPNENDDPSPQHVDSGGLNEAISPDELFELQACVAEDATLAVEPPGARLRRVLGTGKAPAKQAAAYRDLVDIAADVEKLRGLRYSRPFRSRFVSSDKIGELVGGSASGKESATIRFDDLALSALGVLRPGEHLRDLYSELTSDQVAGFYRPRINELVVPTPGPGEPLAPYDKAVLAHELEHALVDQSVGFSHVLPMRAADRDGSLAALSVVEGSATLTGYRWTQAGLSFLDQLRLTGDPRVAGAELPAGIPSYLIRQFTFPYLEGLLFVCALYDEGGWDFVNRALRNPPTTSLEILQPSLYLNGYDPPRPPKVSPPGSGWKHEFSTTFGAANWLWLLEAPGNKPDFGLEDARELAGEWAGGQIHAWTRGAKVAVAVVGRSTGHDFCRSLLYWYDFSFGDDVRTVLAPSLRANWVGERQSAAISCPGNQVRLGIAPSMDPARRIVLDE
jgi:hypothetical protein